MGVCSGSLLPSRQLGISMKRCEKSCIDKADCLNTGECCHSCLYFVKDKCHAMGANIYFPMHYRRQIVGG